MSADVANLGLSLGAVPVSEVDYGGELRSMTGKACNTSRLSTLSLSLPRIVPVGDQEGSGAAR